MVNLVAISPLELKWATLTTFLTILIHVNINQRLWSVIQFEWVIIVIDLSNHFRCLIRIWEDSCLIFIRSIIRSKRSWVSISIDRKGITLVRNLQSNLFALTHSRVALISRNWVKVINYMQAHSCFELFKIVFRFMMNSLIANVRKVILITIILIVKRIILDLLLHFLWLLALSEVTIVEDYKNSHWNKIAEDRDN